MIILILVMITIMNGSSNFGGRSTAEATQSSSDEGSAGYSHVFDQHMSEVHPHKVADMHEVLQTKFCGLLYAFLMHMPGGKMHVVYAFSYD